MASSSPGERIKALRARLNLTQKALGDLLGVSNVTVNRWENDKALPQPATLDRLHRAETDGLHALTTSFASSSSLFPPLSSLLGRQSELARGTDLLQPGTVLTITGPAGVGKSTLARHLVQHVADRYPAGSRWIDCSVLTSLDALADTIARALNLRVANPATRLQTIAEAFQGRELLLILDTCEHLLEPTRTLLSALFPSSSALSSQSSVLITSRSPLTHQSEQILPLDPLDPADAIRLFATLAPAESTSDPAIAELCARLDNLPLAIQLAAARTAILSPRQMLERIDRRFDVIAALARSIQTSAELLSPSEGRLFRACSIFAGECDLPALEAVAGPDATIENLASLIDHALLTIDRGTGEIRYRHLESLRSYGRRWAEELAETDSLRATHAAHFSDLVLRTASDLNGPEQAAALRTFDRDHANFANALAWFIEQHIPASAIPAATAYGRLSRRRATPLDGIAWLERARALPAAIDQPGALTAANELGLLYVASGRLDQAESLFRETIQRATEIGSVSEAGRAWDNLGLVLRSRGDVAGATRAHQTGLDLLLAVDDRRGAGSCRLNLALAANLAGDLDAAKAGCHEALALLGGSDDLWSVASILSNLGEIAGRQGRTDEAADYFERVIEIYRRLEDHDHLAIVAANTAEMRIVRGQYRSAELLIAQAVDQFRADHNQIQLAPSLYLQGAVFAALGENTHALAIFREGIRLSADQHNLYDVAYSLEAIARLHLEAGDPTLALRFWAGMDAIRQRESVPEYPLLNYQETARLMIDRFGTVEDHPEYRRGAEMSADQLVTEAIHLGAGRDGEQVLVYRVLDSAPTTSPVDRQPTPRQLEILRLMAAGRTNREIADELAISPRTVERHITQIFYLLGADRRSAAVAIAAALGLL